MTGMTAAENAKFQHGALKWPVSEIPPVAIKELGAVMKHGADKYGAFNWRGTGVDIRTYFNAAMRHLLAMWDGQTDDPDSGRPHAAHVMACMAVILDAASMGKLEDNRPTIAGILAGLHNKERSQPQTPEVIGRVGRVSTVAGTAVDDPGR